MRTTDLLTYAVQAIFLLVSLLTLLAFIRRGAGHSFFWRSCWPRSRSQHLQHLWRGCWE